jgi:hypothetical protein
MHQGKQLHSTHAKPRRPRIMRSKAQWQSLITEYENSPLSQQAFCNKHQIAVSSFHKWRKRFDPQPSPAAFVEIGQTLATASVSEQTSNNAEKSWEVELELGQGLVLRLRCA